MSRALVRPVADGIQLSRLPDTKAQLILVVEDTPTGLLSLQNAFQKLHVTTPVHYVANGDDAIAYLNGEGPYADNSQFPEATLVLLKLDLPTISGYEVIHVIRSNPRFQNLPVVVLVDAETSHKEIDEAYHFGANSYLENATDLHKFHSSLLSLNRYILEPHHPEACLKFAVQ
ncbi:MAG: putative response regulator, CheY [Pedosphaera sp.]|nr:putative response regulator, CheY [Pedosphaera sp.]